jgi:FtsH-binding integral membrane protein
MNSIEDLKYKLTEKDFNELKYSGILTIVLVVIIYLSAFENNNYTCKNILVNIYLYVILSLLIFHIMTLLFVNADLHISFLNFITNFNRFVILFCTFILFGGILLVFDMNSNNIIVSHLILLLLISLISLFTSLMYAILKKTNLYNKVFYTTLMFIVVLLLLFYFYQDILKKYLKNEYLYIILILLFVVLIVEIVYILLMGYDKTMNILISAIVLIIFGYLLLVDTQHILEITENNCNKALKSCKTSIYNDHCNPDDYPSYPQKSFSIFNDIIVIFQRMSQIFIASED